MTRPGGSGPLGLRLALVFVAVALSAMALLAAATAVSATADISHLAATQRAELTQAMTAGAAAAWNRADTWKGADLGPVLDVGGRIGTDVEITDSAGRRVTASPGFDHGKGPVQHAPVIARGQRVGRIALRLTGAGFTAADDALRTALWRAIAGAAGLAALLALLVGLAVARRITRPVGQLIEVARAMGRGDRTARVGETRAPGELRDLAAAFDGMADALARQEQLRRDVVADVAHELRTPVAVLQAGHEALLDQVVEPTADQLSSLRDEVLRLARMVEDLHTLAAAEAAALQLSRSPCDLGEEAASAADRLTARFDAADVALERRLASAAVLADSDRLHQVITNLLQNALKFTPPGGHVILTAGPAGAQAKLSVSDTGSGIAEDELPHIFDRFWRGRQAAGVAGSGIGLAVVAELVRAHNGTIDVTSTEAKGTEIVVTLPRADR